MRFIFVSFMFVQINFLSYTQVDSLDITQIQRINLIDYQNLNYDWYYLTEYAIIPENDVWKFYQTKQKHEPNRFINPARARKNPLKNNDEQILLRSISVDGNSKIGFGNPKIRLVKI